MKISYDKDSLYVDLSYFIFYRFFATDSWFKRQSEDKPDNECFLKKYKDMFIKVLLEWMIKSNVDADNMFLIRDSSRENIWRNEHHKEYKGTRQVSSNFNKDIFKYTYDNIIPEMYEKYKILTIHIDKLEADDVIALLTKETRKYNSDVNINIITNDNDYVQLCIDDDNVKIINLQGIEIKNRVGYDPALYLKIKIIMGDKSDNISSIGKKVGIKTASKLALSPDLLEAYFLKHPESRDKYELNKLLIDFNNIPDELKMQLETYINI